jgi:hypothetical protein
MKWKESIRSVGISLRIAEARAPRTAGALRKVRPLP